MWSHELCKAQHSHVRVVTCIGICAFDPSFGVGWREILNWYPVQWARPMEMIVIQSEAQQELPNIGDTGGPGWHSDPGGASYNILEM